MRIKRSHRHVYKLLASAAYGLSFIGAVHAQSTVPEPASAGPTPSQASANDSHVQDIVVTARRVSENLQQVPISVGTVDANELNARQILNFQDLKGAVAGLTTSRTGTAASGYVSIRGYTGQALPTPAGDSGVGLYIDGVYIARQPGNGVDIADLARVEVLRGPQGTLFGRNSDSGAINFITSNPNMNRMELKLDGLYGNYNHFRGSVIANAPLTDNLAVRLVYQHNQEDGDVKNTTTSPGYLINGQRIVPQKEFGKTNSNAFSGKVRWTGIKGLTVDYKYDYESVNEVPAPTQIIGFLPGGLAPTLASILPLQAPGAVLQSFTRLGALDEDFQDTSKVRNSGHLLTLEYAVDDHLSIKNISAWRKTHSSSEIDLDGGDWQVPLPPTYTSTLPFCVSCSINDLRQSQFSQEDQIIGKYGNFNFIGGLYYFVENSRFLEEYFSATVIPPYPASYTVPTAAFIGQGPGPLTLGEDGVYRNRSYAAYAHGDFAFNDAIKLSAGIRYTKDKRHTQDLRTFAVPPGIYDVSYGKVTYDVALNYQVNNNDLLYAKFGTGYASGGVLGNVAFKPETTKQVEVGAKTEFFDRRLRLNAALYYTWINNRIVADPSFSSTNSPILAAAGYSAPYPLGIILYNQNGQGTVKGFELEATLTPVRGLTLNANFSYNDPKNADRSLYETPKTNFSFSGEYDFPHFANDSFVLVRLDGDYRSKYYGAGLTNLSVYNGTVPTALINGYSSSAAYLAAEERAAIAGDYWLANGRVAIADIPVGRSKAKIAAFVQNIFDNHGLIFSTDYGAGVNGDFERPRTYGVEVNFNF